jgi:fructose transport system permease protein
MTSQAPGVPPAASLATASSDDPLWMRVARNQVAGPFLALLIAVVVFSLTTDTFLRPQNFSLIFQQSVVIGILALGQTLIILTAGIDLAAGAIAVLGSVVMARFVVGDGNPVAALLLGALVCAACGAVSGFFVSRVKLPPFIVTLGVLTVLLAGARLYTQQTSYTVPAGLLTLLGDGFVVFGAKITYGMAVWIGLALVIHFALSQTSSGRHLFAVGDRPESARLAGINVTRILQSVYVVAALVYAIAAWAALGRIPVADPSGYGTANLDSITAVVIGGTSLFGGRGGVLGTLIGTLIVAVLANGLTQAGIDSLYQQVAIGILVIIAVAVDQLIRRRNIG